MKNKELRLEVKASGELLAFLTESFRGRSRTTVKSFLANRQVAVNNITTTQFNHRLDPGDTVSVRFGRMPEALRHPMLKIVHEDQSILVIDKRHGLLSIATDSERTRTAYRILRDHVRSQDPHNKIFVVHRLDRETSGLMLFARSEAVKLALQNNWKEAVYDRRYVAVTEGEIPDDEGVVEAPLAENMATHKVYVPRDGSGIAAATHYRVLRRGQGRTLVELRLDTGRKNQIRAHLEWLGCPIAGDWKYGARENPAGRVCLHAHMLCFIHPATGERMEFCTRIPQLFEELVK